MLQEIIEIIKKTSDNTEEKICYYLVSILPQIAEQDLKGMYLIGIVLHIIFRIPRCLAYRKVGFVADLTLQKRHFRSACKSEFSSFYTNILNPVFIIPICFT